MHPLDEDAVKSILSTGRHMGRERYQEGRLVLVGKNVKKWRGHFYVYERLADGSEIRRFRNVQLGLKSEMDKAQARAKLRDMIAQETSNVVPAPADVTLSWFKKTVSFRRRSSSGRSRPVRRRSVLSRTIC